MVKPVRRREVVCHLQKAHDVSERKACGAAGFGRASHRYKSRRDPQVALRMRRKELTETRVRYGYKCSACGFDFEATYGQLGHRYIECHHLNPLSDHPAESSIHDHVSKILVETVLVLARLVLRIR